MVVPSIQSAPIHRAGRRHPDDGRLRQFLVESLDELGTAQPTADPANLVLHLPDVGLEYITVAADTKKIPLAQEMKGSRPPPRRPSGRRTRADTAPSLPTPPRARC